MMTRNHRQEALCRAYVRTIAAQAGVLCSQPDPDYGIDLSLRAVEIDARRRRDVSVQVDLQLRSTTRANITESAVAYDLDVPTYNNLRVAGACPRILVVLVLPDDEKEWVWQSPAELAIRRCAYWLSLEEFPPTTATRSLRTEIPLANVFSAEAVHTLLQQARERSHR
jgi:hypothetical protein